MLVLATVVIMVFQVRSAHGMHHIAQGHFDGAAGGSKRLSCFACMGEQRGGHPMGEGARASRQQLGTLMAGLMVTRLIVPNQDSPYAFTLISFLCLRESASSHAPPRTLPCCFSFTPGVRWQPAVLREGGWNQQHGAAGLRGHGLRGGQLKARHTHLAAGGKTFALSNIGAHMQLHPFSAMPACRRTVTLYCV